MSAMTPGLRPRAVATKAATSGRSPAFQSSRNWSTGSANGSASWRVSSILPLRVEPEVGGDPVDRPGELLAAGLRGAAELVGDLLPGLAQPPGVGDGPLLGR